MTEQEIKLLDERLVSQLVSNP